MLVLERQIDGKVIMTVPPSDVPTRIDVTLTDARHSRHGIKAKLGFDAPQPVRILRGEVFNKIEREARGAGKVER